MKFQYLILSICLLSLISCDSDKVSESTDSVFIEQRSSCDFNPCSNIQGSPNWSLGQLIDFYNGQFNSGEPCEYMENVLGDLSPTDCVSLHTIGIDVALVLEHDNIPYNIGNLDGTLSNVAICDIGLSALGSASLFGGFNVNDMISNISEDECNGYPIVVSDIRFFETDDPNCLNPGQCPCAAWPVECHLAVAIEFSCCLDFNLPNTDPIDKDMR